MTWPTAAELAEHMNIPGVGANQPALDRAHAGAVAEMVRKTIFEADEAAVPADVFLATLFEGAKLYGRRKTPDGIAGDSEFGFLRVNQFDSDVNRLIEDYLAVDGFA